MGCRSVNVVIQVGIYRHSMCGVFVDLQDAINAALRFEREQNTDRRWYHTYEVLNFDVDEYEPEHEGMLAAEVWKQKVTMHTVTKEDA